MIGPIYRYVDCLCKGENHHPTWANGRDGTDGFLPDCQERVLFPDLRLHYIAEAPRCKHDKIDEHRIVFGLHDLFKSVRCSIEASPHQCEKCWCPGSTELRDLLDSLTLEAFTLSQP